MGRRKVAAEAAGPEPRLILGDCTELLKTLPENHFDACVTDPPYDLVSVSRGGSSRVPGTGPFGRHREGTKPAPGGGFMGHEWDATGVAFKVETWREVLRVLKPGGHLLSFGGSRTFHRMACAIEDAGFEIRDSVAYHYGSGFPKSLDVGKAIDRQVVGTRVSAHGTDTRAGERASRVRGGAGYWAGANPKEVPLMGGSVTEDARRWDGWGTALKPAFEPIVLARKPLSEGTVAANMVSWGTGALNIDACRIPYASEADAVRARYNGLGPVERASEALRARRIYGGGKKAGGFPETFSAVGRWPANVVLAHDGRCGDSGDGCVPGCPVRILDEQSGPNTGAFAPVRGTEPSSKTKNVYGVYGKKATPFYGDRGGASRFFYCAKAAKSERGFFCRVCGDAFPSSEEGAHRHGRDDARHLVSHPTQKPLGLIHWLLVLVCRPGGRILDPFLGTGTTAVAAAALGVECVGIERDPAYIAWARKRCYLMSIAPSATRKKMARGKSLEEYPAPEPVPPQAGP